MVLKLAFFILLGVFAFVVTVQDFRTRLISLWVIIGYWAICLVSTILLKSVHQLLVNAGGSVLYFTFCFSVVIAYYFIKHRRFINIIDSKIGLADLLLFGAIGITLELAQLILFFASGFCFAAFAGYYLSKKEKTVPLAGILVSWHFVVLFLIELLQLEPVL